MSKTRWELAVDSQKKVTKPIATLASAHQGVARGDPMYAIWAQSKVIRDMPKPLVYPNKWLTVMLFGAIQQTQLKKLSADGVGT